VDAGPVDALGVDQMKLLEIGEWRVVLARTNDGLSAFSDRCTHKGGPLSDGALVCGVVQCPWHGSQFDVRDGAVSRGPARESIQVFEVREAGGRAEVNLPPVRHAPC
jgi:nitrite reductase/ring-hydroxylating ferredoxin subunit